MNKFVATKVENGFEYSETIEAKTESDAQDICEKNGWQLEGQLIMSIPFEAATIEEIEALCNMKNIGIH